MPREPQEQNEANEDIQDIEIEEILEDEVLTSPRAHTHYYVSIGDESYFPSNESNRSDPIASPPIDQFLKVPMPSRVRSAPLINYSNSQVLTSSEHISKLQEIAKKRSLWKRRRLQN